MTGRSAIQMCIQELSTCKQYHLPTMVVNLTTATCAWCRQWQEFFYGNPLRRVVMDALPDFVKLAEAYGHVGIKIEKPATWRRAQGSVQAEGATGVHGLHHRPGRKRVSDDPGRQGLDRVILAEEAVSARGRGSGVHMRAYSLHPGRDESGALSRISGLFSARGYNIDSLTVAPTEDPTMSRFHDRHHRLDDVIEQITKQLNKLVKW